MQLPQEFLHPDHIAGLLEASPDGIVVVDPQGSHVYANPAFYRMSGFFEEELVGHPPGPQNYWPVEELERTQEAFDRTLAQDFVELRLTFKRKNGERFPCLVNSSCVKNEKGKAIYFFAIMRDMTSLQKAEHGLKESAERLRDLMENMSSGVAVYEEFDDGNDFIFKEINKAGEKSSNVRREEVVGKKVTAVFPAVAEMGLLDVFRRVWKSGRPESQAVTLYKDGRISQWVENYVYRLASGEIVAIYDDVTELRRAKEELQNIFDLSVDMIGIASLDGFFKRVNPAFTRTLGYSEEELLAKSFIEFVHPEDVAMTQDVMEKKLASGQAVINFENRHRHKDGSYRWLSWMSTPVEGGLLYGVARDVTEQKRALQVLEQREQELKHMLRCPRSRQGLVWGYRSAGNWPRFTGERSGLPLQAKARVRP